MAASGPFGRNNVARKGRQRGEKTRGNPLLHPVKAGITTAKKGSAQYNQDLAAAYKAAPVAQRRDAVNRAKRGTAVANAIAPIHRGRRAGTKATNAAAQANKSLTGFPTSKPNVVPAFKGSVIDTSKPNETLVRKGRRVRRNQGIAEAKRDELARREAARKRKEKEAHKQRLVAQSAQSQKNGGNGRGSLTPFRNTPESMRNVDSGHKPGHGFDDFAKGAGKLAVEMVKNAPRDAKDIVTSLPGTVEYMWENKTRPDRIAGDIGKQYWQIVTHPGEELGERPVSTLLALAPAGKGVSLGAGKAARLAGKQTLKREPARVEGTVFRAEREGSRGLVGRAVQSRKDKRDLAKKRSGKYVASLDANHGGSRPPAKGGNRKGEAGKAKSAGGVKDPTALEGTPAPPVAGISRKLIKRRSKLERAIDEHRESRIHATDKLHADTVKKVAAAFKQQHGAPGLSVTKKGRSKRRKLKETIADATNSLVGETLAANNKAMVEEFGSHLKAERGTPVSRDVVTADGRRLTPDQKKAILRATNNPKARKSLARQLGVSVKNLDKVATREVLQQLKAEKAGKTKFVIKDGDRDGTGQLYKGNRRAEQVVQELEKRAESTPGMPKEWRVVQVQRATNQNKRAGEPGQPPLYGVVPTEVTARLARHKTVGTSPAAGARLQRMSRSAFTNAALVTNTGWLAGQGTEAGIRSLLTGAGPLDAVRFKKIVKEMNKLEAGAGDRFKANVRGEALSETGPARGAGKTLEENWKDNAIAPAAAAATGIAGTAVGRMGSAAWKKYNRLVFDQVNGTIERAARQGMAGHHIKQGHLMERRVLGLSNKAIHEAAKGLLDTPTQRLLARQVDGSYGKYSKFSPDVRELLLHWTPFAPWFVNSAKFSAQTLPVDHPMRQSLVIAAEEVAEDWRKSKGRDYERPDFLRERVAVGGKLMRLDSPFGAANDPVAKMVELGLPQFSGAQQAWQYNNDWTGKPLMKKGKDGKEVRYRESEKNLYGAKQLLESHIPLLRQALKVSGIDDRIRQVPKDKRKSVGGRVVKELNPLRPIEERKPLPKRKPKKKTVNYDRGRDSRGGGRGGYGRDSNRY